MLDGASPALVDAAVTRWPWLVAADALIDSWWGLIPLLIGSYAAMRICLTLYRWMFRLGGGALGARHQTRRLERLAFYAAALSAMEMVLIALVWGLGTADQGKGFIPLRTALTMMSVPAALLALIVALWSMAGLVLFTGKLKFLRIFLTLVAFPVMAFVAWNLVVLASHWVAGFVAVAVRSMTV